MAEFIRKIVRRQSRSSSPLKRRHYEVVPWTNPCTASELPAMFSAPYAQSTATSAAVERSCCICQYCHAALHHDCIKRNHPQFPVADLCLPPVRQEYSNMEAADNPHTDSNQYQTLPPNNYHFSRYDFQVSTFYFHSEFTKQSKKSFLDFKTWFYLLKLNR
uniref:Phorbol-ester/DAG-type domain-containing protein n=1 Tax=Syphacia muris TaxID=451379 RepID=A0A0N5ALJ0_9BILA